MKHCVRMHVALYSSASCCRFLQRWRKIPVVDLDGISRAFKDSFGIRSATLSVAWQYLVTGNIHNGWQMALEVVYITLRESRNYPRLLLNTCYNTDFILHLHKCIWCWTHFKKILEITLFSNYQYHAKVWNFNEESLYSCTHDTIQHCTEYSQHVILEQKCIEVTTHKSIVKRNIL